MLCESLMLLLIEDGSIRKQQSLAIIEDIVGLKLEIAGTTEDVVVSLESIQILRSVGLSLSAAREPTPTMV